MTASKAFHVAGFAAPMMVLPPRGTAAEIGGIAGLSLMMRVLCGMDTTGALALLIGLVAAIPTSDRFSRVLMGSPGSSASQATVLDSAPLVKHEQAARALSAAVFAALVGGLIRAVILTGFVAIARPPILAVFGLSMVGVLAGKPLIKGIAACAPDQRLPGGWLQEGYRLPWPFSRARRPALSTPPRPPA